MRTTVEDDIHKLHVVGTAGVTARLGLRGIHATRRTPVAAAGSGVHGELVELPHVIGAAGGPLHSTATARPARIASAA